MKRLQSEFKKRPLLRLGLDKKWKSLPNWYFAPDLIKGRFNKGHMNKLILLSRLSGNKGLILDIGYWSKPNPFLNKPIGLDINADYCPKNYKKVIQHKLGVDNLPFKNNSVDGIILGEVLMYVFSFGEMHKAFSEFNRVLKKGGKLIISEFNRFYPIHIFMYFFDGLFGIRDLGFMFFRKRMVETIVGNYGFKLKKVYGDFFEIPFTNITLSLNLPKLTYHTIYELVKIKTWSEQFNVSQSPGASS